MTAPPQNRAHGGVPHPFRLRLNGWFCARSETALNLNPAENPKVEVDPE